MTEKQILRDEPGAEPHLKNLLADFGQPWWQSLFSNLKDAFFSEAQPPLQLTSRPVEERKPSLQRGETGPGGDDAERLDRAHVISSPSTVQW